MTCAMPITRPDLSRLPHGRAATRSSRIWLPPGRWTERVDTRFAAPGTVLIRLEVEGEAERHPHYGRFSAWSATCSSS